MNRKQRRLQEKASKSGNSAEYFLNLGIELAGQGKAEKAISAFRSALRKNPGDANARYCLGTMLSGEGRFDEAITSFRAALKLQPNHFDTLYNLGNALQAASRLDEAAASYRQAAQANPGHAAVHANLGNALKSLGRIAEATASYEQSIAVDPGFANAHYNLGVLQLEQGRPADAVNTLGRAVSLAPGHPALLCNLGLAYNNSGRFDEAVTCYRQALAADPKFAEAHNNLGNTLLSKGRQEDAIACFTTAIEIEPGNTDVYVNLANTFKEMERFEEAETICRQALALDAGQADIHFVLSLVLLRTGRLQEGWQEYKWRWLSTEFKTAPRAFSRPLWDGSDLNGKSIALWGEQGIGDEIRFAGIIPDILDKGADITIECDPRLVGLFERSFGGARIIGRADDLSVAFEETCDYQLPVMDLAGFFRPTIDSFPPSPYAYLKPASDRLEFWHRRLAELGPRPKIGILWRSIILSGDQSQAVERSRDYATVDELEPILSTGGVDFINLMYAECREDRARIKELYDIDLHTWDDIDLKDDQDDLAALISGLGLVIGPSTSTTYLAAALGVPVFDFCTPGSATEMLGHPEAPGLAPSMRYFFKDYKDPWQPVMADIAAELKSMFGLP